MNRKLQKIYEKILNEEVQEEIENPITSKFSKFDLDDYSSIVYKQEEVVEEKRGHGDTAAVEDLIKQGIREGLIRHELKNERHHLYSLKDRTHYIAHKGDTALHSIRRFLERLKTL